MDAMDAKAKILHLFDSNSISYKLISHAECRTSEESTKARAEGGGGIVIGAKAILMKVERKQEGSEFDVFVLPSNKKIDSKLLKSQLNKLKSFRFSTALEMAEKTFGLVPGSMPPFANPIFDELENLFIDSSLLKHNIIGFNAACLTQSIIVSCHDYIQVANPSAIFSFSC